VQLFNSLTQQYATFEPQGEGVSLYVCGVTPYDTAHLGHAFVYSTFDVLVRLLRFRGFTVRYVQNVTDIDDALFARVRELGDVTWDALARRETERFVHEMEAINIGVPERLVPASTQLPAMLELIAQLLQGGFAYVRDGWVYFSVRRDPMFGRLAYAAGLLDDAQRLEVAISMATTPLTHARKTPWTSCSGASLSPTSRLGRVRGAPVGLDGILSAPPSRPRFWGRNSTSTVGERI